MPELDVDACAEILTEIIEDEGEIVFTNYANVGPPLLPEEACVRKFRGKYWADSRCAEGEFCGPYETLREAFEDDGDEGMLLAIVDAGEIEVKCAEMSAADVAAFLNVVCDEADINVAINGENWVPDGDGSLIRDPNEVEQREFLKRAKLVLSRSDERGTTTNIYRYGAGLWAKSGDAALTGPYSELEDAVAEAEINMIDAPTVFSSKELSATEIVELLESGDFDVEEPIPLTINGQQWAVRPDGEIRRSRSTKPMKKAPK